MNVELNPQRASGERDPRPIVTLPRQPMPAILIAAIGIGIAILLFLILDAQRRSARSPEGESPAVAFAPPPELAIPAEPGVEPQGVLDVPLRSTRPAPIQAQPQLAPPTPRPAPPEEPFFRPLPSQVPRTRAPAEPRTTALAEPALVIDASAQADSTSPNPSTALPVGTLISAVLETPIDTARPGLARAIVSRDARGFDGRKVLIPRGSRLIGEYDAEVRRGQNRVLVNWTQVILPDGFTIQLASPAADPLGGTGIPGKVDSFFLARFFNAAMQSALNIGANLAAGGGNTVIVGLPNSGIAAATGQANAASDDFRPKIRVKQGTMFNVFVARDLDFTGAPRVQ